MSQILLVEIEKSTLKILTTILKTEGYKTVSASSLQEASKLVATGEFGLMIADASSLAAPDLELLRSAKESKPATTLIVILTPGQDIAPLMTGREVFASLHKPFKMDDLLTSVQRALDYSDKALAEMANMRVHIEAAYRFSEIVAESPAMRSVCDMISRIAATEVNVLITGENGTGKGLVARVIHAHSMRKGKKYSVVDCRGEETGALESILFGKGGEEGVLEKTNGGTVFLSAVDALPLPVQAKLLTLIRERQFVRVGADKPVRVDLRLLAGVGGSEPGAGRLNNDLYGILKAISIVIPPLRDRVEDIEPLVIMTLNRLVDSTAIAPRVDAEAMKFLKEYRWPGNVRELEEVVKHACAAKQGNIITVQSLPAYMLK